MNWDKPRLAEFCPPNAEDPFVQVDVLSIKG